MPITYSALKTQFKKLKDSNKPIILTIEQDGEHDDIMLANWLRGIAADPKVKQINIILDQGNPDYMLTYKEKLRFYRALPSKFNLIQGTSDINQVLKTRYTLTPAVSQAFSEANIICVTGPGIALTEFHAANPKKKAFLAARSGGVNDSWTAKYILTHFMNVSPEVAQQQPAQQAEAVRRVFNLYHEIAEFTTLSQNFSLRELFGKQKLPNKRAVKKEFNSITPDFYPLFSAVLADAATQEHGTELGNLFVRTAHKSNVALLTKWGRYLGLVVKEKSLTDALAKIAELPDVEATLLKKDVVKYLSLDLKTKPIELIDNVCNALEHKTLLAPFFKKDYLHPDPKKRKRGDNLDVEGTLIRLSRTIRYPYQMLGADQFVAFILDDLFGTGSNILTSKMTPQTFSGVNNGYATTREITLAEQRNLHNAFLQVADHTSLSPMIKEKGLINGTRFQTECELKLLQSLTTQFIQPTAPSFSLVRDFLNINIQSVVPESKIYARLTQKREEAPSIIKRALNLKMQEARHTLSPYAEQKEASKTEEKSYEPQHLQELIQKPTTPMQKVHFGTTSSSPLLLSQRPKSSTSTQAPARMSSPPKLHSSSTQSPAGMLSPSNEHRSTSIQPPAALPSPSKPRHRPT